MDAPETDLSPYVTAYPEIEDALREDEEEQAAAVEPAPEPAPSRQPPTPAQQAHDPNQYSPQLRGVIGDLARQRERARVAEERAAAAEARTRQLEELDAAIDEELDAEERAQPAPGLADDPQAYFDHRFSGHEQRIQESIQRTILETEHRRETERYGREVAAWQTQIVDYGRSERERLAALGEDLAGAEAHVVNHYTENYLLIHPEADPAAMYNLARQQVAELYGKHFSAGKNPYPTLLALAKRIGFTGAAPAQAAAQPAPQPAGKRKAPPAPAAVAQRAARSQVAAPVSTGVAEPKISAESFAALPMDEKIRITRSLPPHMSLYEYLETAERSA